MPYFSSFHDLIQFSIVGFMIIWYFAVAAFRGWDWPIQKE